MFKSAKTRYLPEPTDPHAFDFDPPIRDYRSIGILLINLGTPDKPTPSSIKTYLREFLSDTRVIEMPQIVWQLILRGFVLPFRPKKLAEKYSQIWFEEGSPLLVYSQDQAKGVEERLRKQGLDVHCELGMRYGNPSIQSAMDKLQQKGCERILVLPLYPQYAASTTATAIDTVNRYAARRRNQPEMRFIKRYADDKGYINCMANKVKQFWQEKGMPDYLLLSYHGLPRQVIELGDPYYRDCMDTTMRLKEALGAEGHRVKASFQSRFGAQEWVQPYTEPTLRDWAKKGVKRVDVMCPGFLADCLETLEEIQIECHDAFLEDGGEELNYIPCLNNDANWLDALTDIAKRNLGGWY